MRTHLVNLWHPHGGVTITDMGEKWFLFQFYYEIGLDRKLDIGIIGIENMDSNKELGEEDCFMEIGEGKKRQRRAAGCNGNLMLECSGTGESLIKGELEDIRWQFTGFYGHPMENLRHYSWDLLRNLAYDNGTCGCGL
ncbi:hypothetical protein GOBAR_DD09472 [Gossypium barbadense]|nr:hypothetical protein GOBAR_DD09472 [Gossypium barbadense]